MGSLNFQLPPGLPGDCRRELERACVAGGPEHMPFLTQATLQNGELALIRPVRDSGFLLTPWEVPGFGRLLFRSATLMERPAPYCLSKELARGSLNQLRGQAADWSFSGLAMPAAVAEHIRQATLAFAQGLKVTDPAERIRLSQEILGLTCAAGEELVAAYTDQVFQIRHQRQPKLDTVLGCRVGGVPHEIFTFAFNTCCVNLNWNQLEPNEGHELWQPLDDLLDWAQGKGLTIFGGPLIDFSGFGLPDWLWAKELDLAMLCDHLCDFTARVVGRYRGRVRQWQVTAGSNLAGVFARSEDELLWLTMRLIETARRAAPEAELSIGLAQPLGDYLAQHERSHSPLAFADTLIRTGVKLAALELELIMGVNPRGNYCRHALDISRFIDLYSYLGVPLQITMGYPSDNHADANADPDLAATAGFWHGGFSPACQADWAEHFTCLALCKPLVRTVMWSHFDDSLPHFIPHGGVIDFQGNPKPALERLALLREKHLK